MSRLTKKCGAIKIGMALALFGTVLLGANAARAFSFDAHDFEGEFQTNYFLNKTGSNQDDQINIVNGDNQIPIEDVKSELSQSDGLGICANLYVFNADQQSVGCCAIPVSASGLAVIGVNELITALATADGNPAPTTGTVKIVATNNGTGRNPIPCTASGALIKNLIGEDGKISDDDGGSQFYQLKAWITHSNTTASVTEVPFSYTNEPDTDLTTLTDFCDNDIGVCPGDSM
jgi:hypothetical protein